jgi:hypothetical protein
MQDDFDDLAYLREQVSVLVRSGFFNEDDLETYIAELAFDPRSAPHAQAVRAHARAAMAAKRAEEAGWPAATDWDRLAAAFDALEASGILALHNAGMTTSDAHGDAWDLIGRDPPGTWRGFAFYHGQDVERALDGQSLFIGFEAVAEGADPKRAIGATVVAALKAQGFAPVWNGDPETRLDVPGIKWQKRTDWVRPAGSPEAAAKPGFLRRLFG